MAGCQTEASGAIEKGGMWQSIWPARLSLVGLTLCLSQLECWLATLNGLSTQVPIPVGCWCLYNRITPALVTLHWLPVKYRIEFKTQLIVFKGLPGKAPTHIQEMIAPSKSKRYSIRSNEECVLKVPKFKHDTFGNRAFAVYGPLALNCLPKEIKLCDEIEAFKRNLKTNLYVKFVNESTLAISFWRIVVKCPRMLSAQFVALYKPCKPKPTLIIPHRRISVRYHVTLVQV